MPETLSAEEFAKRYGGAPDGGAKPTVLSAEEWARQYGPKLSQGEPEGVFSRAGRAVKEAVFGAPERAEAEGTGVYQTPTTAQMVEAPFVGAAAAMVGATPVMLLANPVTTGLAIGGSFVGEDVASRVGKKLEKYGAPEGTSKVLGVAGSLAGGLYAPIKGPAALGTAMKMFPHGGMASIAKFLIGDAEKAAVVAAADPLMVAAETLAKQKTFGSATAALEWLNSMGPEQQAAALKQLVPGLAQKVEAAAPQAAKLASIGEQMTAKGAAPLRAEVSAAEKLAMKAGKPDAASIEQAKQELELWAHAKRVKDLESLNATGTTGSRGALDPFREELAYKQALQLEPGLSYGQRGPVAPAAESAPASAAEKLAEKAGKPKSAYEKRLANVKPETVLKKSLRGMYGLSEDEALAVIEATHGDPAMARQAAELLKSRAVPRVPTSDEDLMSLLQQSLKGN